MFWEGNLASWLAVAIGVALIVLAWRGLRLITYIEFHPNWGVELKEGVVTVTGKLTSISPAAYIGAEGSLEFNKNKVKLHSKSIDRHLLEPNTQVLVLEGQYTDGAISGSCPAVLRLKVQLSNGKAKRFKGRAVINQPASQSPL